MADSRPEDLPRKAVIITGGAQGIGAAIARRAAREGRPVVINYHHSEAAAETLCREIEGQGGKAIAVRGDISKAANVRRLFSEAERTYGPPGVVINNAGITGPKSELRDAAATTLREVIDTNLLGCLLCCREAIPMMSRRDGHEGGLIINISSAAAGLGSPGWYVWYAASKGAVETLTIGLAKELGAEGIRVNAIVPGIIDTAIHDKSGVQLDAQQIQSLIPMGRMGTADEIAKAAIWLMSTGADYCSGTLLRISGGR